MVRWRLKELMEQYRETTGEPLLMVHLAHRAGLAPSTIHNLIHNVPDRIGFNTVESLLTFFTPALGPLTTQDLVEFVFDLDS